MTNRYLTGFRGKRSTLTSKCRRRRLSHPDGPDIRRCPPGWSARGQGFVDLSIHVQCTDWIDVDRVQILVNGRKHPDVNFTRSSHPAMFGDGVTKFGNTVRVPLSQDSHIIVVAIGENSTLETGYGSSWQSRMHPTAYSNPIWVDVDGDGFAPNGDTLGWDLPVGGLEVETVRKMLGNAKTE